MQAQALQDLTAFITRDGAALVTDKWCMAPWLCPLLPRHRCYTEAFGGGY